MNEWVSEWRHVFIDLRSSSGELSLVALVSLKGSIESKDRLSPYPSSLRTPAQLTLSLLKPAPLADVLIPVNYFSTSTAASQKAELNPARQGNSPGDSQWKYQKRRKWIVLSSLEQSFISPTQLSNSPYLPPPQESSHCVPWTAFFRVGENNGAKWQRILGCKLRAGLEPRGFIEPSGSCHRGDWLWREFSEIINLITQADTEVFVKMSGLWIVAIYLPFNALVFLKACIFCNIGHSSGSSPLPPPSKASVRKHHMLVFFWE